MAEYIEREALIAEYDRVHIGEAGGARKLMVEAPACDVVEVVHGEWIEKHWYKRGDCYYTKNCSCCNCAVKPKYTYNFCPKCGAKMDGERSDNDG